MLGPAKDTNEFDRRVPKYKELEKLLQADHLKDLERSENQYAQNVALLEQAMKNVMAVFKADPTDVPGAVAEGEYFLVRKGLFVFSVRAVGDQMKFVSVRTLTK